MRILCATLYPNLGGSTRILLAAAEALRAEHEVIVRAPRPEADSPAPSGIPIEPLSTLGAQLVLLPRLAALAGREIAFVRRARPDAIYVHDEPSLYVYGAIGRLLRRPVVWHVHMRIGAGWRRGLRDALCDRRVVISRFVAAAAGGRKPTALIRNPLLAPMPVGVPEPPARMRLTVVGAVGRRKNQMLALEALRVLVRERDRDAELCLIGSVAEPDYAAALQARAAALSLDSRVQLLGEQPPDAVWRGGGIAVFPSTYENQPLALVEALAGGRPVVASDIPAHREILEDVGGDPGSLAALEPSALADAVERTAEVPDAGIAARTQALFARECFDGAVRALFRSLDGAGVRW